MDASGCWAHAYMLGAQLNMRVAEVGHLTFLRAHAALRRMGAWHVKSGCCWLLLLPPTHCVQCHRGLQGLCIERGPCLFLNMTVR
jgi:hypothetical protein